MKPVIKWTLQQRRWSILWWSLGIIAFVILELSIYPSVKNQAAQLDQALKNLPNGVKTLFGSSDLFSPVGYLNTRFFALMLPMQLSILAIGLGSSLIAREEADTTLELLISRPISRTKLILAKLSAGLMITTIIAFVAMLSIILMTRAVNLPMPAGRIVLASFVSYLIALMFGTFAFMVASFGRYGRGASIGLATLVTLGGYIVSTLEGSVQWLDIPAKIIPFHYFKPADILNGHYSYLSIVGFLIIIASMGAISMLAFRRRDVG